MLSERYPITIVFRFNFKCHASLHYQMTTCLYYWMIWSGCETLSILLRGFESFDINLIHYVFFSVSKVWDWAHFKLWLVFQDQNHIAIKTKSSRNWSNFTYLAVTNLGLVFPKGVNLIIYSFPFEIIIFKVRLSSISHFDGFEAELLVWPSQHVSNWTHF